MNKYALLFASVIFCQTTFSQEEETDFENKLNFYPTINLVIGNPIQEFWVNYSKRSLWGFNIDAVVAPFEKAQFIEPGLQVEIFPSSSSTDNWEGIEVSSSSTIARFNAITRIRIAKQRKISPILEFGYGLNMTSTQTSYEIVDEATFLEKFLWDAEDYVEEVKVKEFQDYGQNFYAAAGVSLYGWFNLQVKYNYSPSISFVQKDGIKVTETSIDYETTTSKMQMVVVSVGVSLDKIF